MAGFVLLHSPLVGPLTLSPLAEGLIRLGHRAAAPDLRAAVTTAGIDKRMVEQPLSALTDHAPGDCEPLVIAAHSGAGAYVPALAAELHPDAIVLIDAVMPPPSGAFTPSADFRSELERLVEPDGCLPAWPTWWTEEDMVTLIPDPDLRAAISQECPRVPISFYDSVFEMADGWARPWAGYLRLSVGYEPHASAAETRGWPVHRRSGGHLDTATQPDEVADDLVTLLAPILHATD